MHTPSWTLLHRCDFLTLLLAPALFSPQSHKSSHPRTSQQRPVLSLTLSLQKQPKHYGAIVGLTSSKQILRANVRPNIATPLWLVPRRMCGIITCPLWRRIG